VKGEGYEKKEMGKTDKKGEGQKKNIVTVSPLAGWRPLNTGRLNPAAGSDQDSFARTAKKNSAAGKK
jgi:hypothetical protein